VGHPDGKGTKPWFFLEGKKVMPDEGLPQGLGGSRGSVSRTTASTR